MGNQRGSFAKRQRETDLKDKAREKRERRAFKADQQPRTAKGPEIAWDEAVRYVESVLPPSEPTAPADAEADNQPSVPSASATTTQPPRR
jgi:hypothetical protein